jgi:hypothetical protein
MTDEEYDDFVELFDYRPKWAKEQISRERQIKSRCQCEKRGLIEAWDETYEGWYTAQDWRMGSERNCYFMRRKRGRGSGS